MRLIVLAAIAVAALAQNVPGPAFEVTSVKPADPNSRMGIGLFTYPGGRIVCHMCPLDYLIQEAFQIRPFQMSGAPGWLHQEVFDVEAKPPASSELSKANPRMSKLPPNPEQRQMLQALLVDRFHLKYRRETKEGPVYFLVKTNKKLKLQEPKDKEDFPWVGSAAGGGINGDGLAGLNATMPLLAERLSGYLERLIVDQTGLEGAFDFKFEYHPEGQRPDIISCIFTSVEALGLKLQSGRAPIETLVIESAEKPAAN